MRRRFRQKTLLLITLFLVAGCQTLSTETSAPDNSVKEGIADIEREVVPEHLLGVMQYGLHKQAASPMPVATKRLASFSSGRQSVRECVEGSFTLKDVAVNELKISNQDVATVSRLLSVIGYKVIDLAQQQDLQTSVSFSCAEFPIIVIQSSIDEQQLTFTSTGGSGNGGGAASSYASSSPYVGAGGSVSSTENTSLSSLRKANSGELDRILVFYHPEYPEAFTSLEEIINTKIDTPSTQVYIETLVLEVNEEDSKELGVQFESANIFGSSLLGLGSLEFKGGDTLDFERNTRKDSSGNPEFTPGSGVRFKLRALIESGRADVLSRPSVLALSNRQAVIQIVDVIQTPVLSQTILPSGELSISQYNFEPLLLGITLNLRPRVSADRKWVSMEIDATVEAEVDENTGEVYAADPDGGRILLAEKPGSSSRKVRTFARIPDRTPIIIGGLVAGNKDKQRSRVPLLGDIPVLGNFFGATDNEVKKREVIIVMIPYILAEDAIGVASNTPKDSVIFNDQNMILFNNNYRIRSEDIFDLGFLLKDPYFTVSQRKVHDALLVEPDLAEKDPFRQFIGGNIPGGDALVSKMLYDIVANESLGLNIDARTVYLTTYDGNGSLTLTELEEIIEKNGIDQQPDRGLLITFGGTSGKSSAQVHHEVVALSKGTSWEQYSQQHLGSKATNNYILIRNNQDKTRVLHSILVNEMLDLNGGYDNLTLQYLQKGQVLKLPSLKDRTRYLLTSKTAAIYKDVEDYYSIFLNALDSAYRQIDGHKIREVKELPLSARSGMAPQSSYSTYPGTSEGMSSSPLMPFPPSSDMSPSPPLPGY